MKDQDRKVKIADWLVFSILLIVMSAVCLLLFYRQTIVYQGNYMSDMEAYVRKMIGTEEVYSFPYPIFFRLGWVISFFTRTPEMAIALATMLLNALALCVTKLIFQKEIGQEDQGSGALKKGLFVTCMVFALFFVSMLYADRMTDYGIHFHYLGVFTPTPWQNATYLAARPFAILAFVWWVRVFSIYEKQGKILPKEVCRDYIWFALFMLMVTMTKPSYTLPHLAAAGIVLIYRLIRSGFKNIRQTFYVGLCYVPTLLDLLYQYKGVFVGESVEESGVGLAPFYVWSQYTDNLPLALLLAGAFPLCVLVCHIKILRKNPMLTFAWQLYLAGLLMAVLLYEKGFRRFDFNFSWGYMCGLFAVFFVSTLELLKDTLNIKKRRSNIAFVTLSLEWVLFLAHLFCGIRYFLLILSGGSYY